jgi:hypothetical protein
MEGSGVDFLALLGEAFLEEDCIAIPFLERKQSTHKFAIMK